MNPKNIIKKYYPVNSKAYNILIGHSEAVAQKALQIIDNHPDLKINKAFIYEAALLHDIGILYTNATEIGCTGDLPYICHGYKGRELLEKEGFPVHARICERHTGTGLSKSTIQEQQLPIPQRDMRPVTIEEQLICFADKFFSKSKNLTKEKPIEKIRKSLAKHGPEQVAQFDQWCHTFL